LTWFRRFTNAPPTDGSFFPIAVWFEAVNSAAEAQTDRAAGLNTYVMLTANSDLGAVRSAGLHAIVAGGTSNPGSETMGWLLSDEIDMTAGPVQGAQQQQQILASLPADARLRYANYGKGVLFWETDAEAARFVNTYQDLTSADGYWYTDLNICSQYEGGALLAQKTRALTSSECHRAANYGAAVERMRSLVSPKGSKPIWAFVELGHPASESGWPTITPAQARAAVWSSIIHGARGVIYFNHSFGGACPSQHILRDPCYSSMRQTITAVNAQIAQLAPVLNSPSLVDLVGTSGKVDVLVKSRGGRLFVIAGSTATAAQTVSFNAACVGNQTVTVEGEGRTLNAVGGVFSDQFSAETAVHIYSMDSAPCGR